MSPTSPPSPEPRDPTKTPGDGVQERAAKIEALFDAARAKPSEEREGFVDEACCGDEALRAEVLLLLGAVEGAWGLAAGVKASPEIEAELARLKPEEEGERIGNYKLLEKIGEGAFGTVWVAEQERPVRRRVALKIIKLGMDTREVIARFEQERQALAMMDHPNIAKVFDAGATEWGRPFFVMELVRGVKITEYCDRAKLTTRERLDLFIAVCHAVQHAHQKGIIHRDLKPSNILVTLHDGVPVSKVIDFGVAKAIQQQRLTDLTVYTKFEQMIGTPLYMSPEQAEMSGLDIDTRSDIYSLGVLLYELLTGRTPFDPEELMRHGLDEIRRVIREQEPQTPSMFFHTMAVDLRTNVAQHRQSDPAKLTSQLRGDLDWIIMKALEKDRTRRYETANGLAKDIERHLASEPVLARPPSARYRLERAVRRNRAAFLAGVIVLAALVAGATIATWQAMLARRAGNAAEIAKADALRQAAIAEQASANAQAGKARAQEEAERRRSLLVEASSLSHEAALGRLSEAQRGDGRVAEALAYLSRSLAFDPANSAAQATAVLTLTGEGRALGPRWPAYALHSDVPICVSPDGSTLASVENADAKSSIAFTEMRERFATRRVAEFPEEISEIVFHPGGRVLAIRMKSDAVLLWDVNAAAPIGERIVHRRVWGLEFSPDGRWLATHSLNHTARIWDAATGSPTSPWLAHGNQATAARFSSDSRKLLTVACLEDAARIWEVPGGDQIGEPIKLKGPMDAASFSPDGRILATAERWGAIQLWNLETRATTAGPIAHQMFVKTLAFTRDGRWLVSACSDPEALLVRVDAATLKPTRLKHDGKVDDADFSPDGRWLATASQDGTVRLWEVATGKALCDPLRHPVAVQEVRFSSSGEWIVTRGIDLVLRIWPCPALPSRGRILLPRDDRAVLEALTTSPEKPNLSPEIARAVERMLATDPASGLPLSRAQREGRLLISPDGKTLLAENGSRKPPACDGRIWRVGDWILLGVAACGETVTPSHSLFSPDSSFLIVQGHDTRIETDPIRVFSTATGRLLHSATFSASLHGVAVSPEGTFLAAGNTLRGFHVFRLPGLEPVLKDWIHPRERYGMFNSIQFSPDGAHLLTSAKADNSGDVWEVKTGIHGGIPMQHRDEVNMATYSKDGRLIVTASNDRTVRIWDAKTHAQVGEPLTHPSAVSSAQFSADGQWILTSTATYYTRGESFLWAARTGRLVARLQVAGPCAFAKVADWLGVQTDHDYRAVELPELEVTASGELSTLLELQAGLHLDAQGRLAPIAGDLAAEQLATLREKLSRSGTDSAGTRLLRWWLENPRIRRVSPRDQNTVSDVIESYVAAGMQSANRNFEASCAEEAWKMDPLHPLVHVALARCEENRETVRVLQSHGVQRRLLAADNEQLYGRERWARFARTSVRFLLQGKQADEPARQFARTALDLAARLDPACAELPELQRLVEHSP